jgi:hypothetical protein
LGSSTTNINKILIEGTTSQDKFLRFRRGGGTPVGNAGIQFSSFETDSFFNYASTGALLWGYNAGNPTAQGNYGTEVMRLNNDGNLGIGTSAPSQKLDVGGSINALNNITFGGRVIGPTGAFTDVSSTRYVGSTYTGATGSFGNLNVGPLTGATGMTGTMKVEGAAWGMTGSFWGPFLNGTTQNITAPSNGLFVILFENVQTNNLRVNAFGNQVFPPGNNFLMANGSGADSTMTVPVNAGETITFSLINGSGSCRVYHRRMF